MDNNSINNSNGGPEGPESMDAEAVSARFDRRRCGAVHLGQQCLRHPGHKGRHMATGGAFMYWDKTDGEDQANQSAAALLLWLAWAKELKIDPLQLRNSLLAVCAASNLHPSALLIDLF